MADYIPSGDAEFNAWLDNFAIYANADLADSGLVAGAHRVKNRVHPFRRTKAGV